MLISRRTALALLVVLVTFLAPAAAVLSADELLIENGLLVDPANETLVEGDLLIVDGVITQVSAQVSEDFLGRRIDASGKWVVPALRDMHTHSYGNAGLNGEMEFVGTPVVARRMLYAGVASFLDLFAGEDQILGLRDQQRDEGLPGASIFAAGPCLTATAGHCTEYGVPTRIVDTPEDARREVTELAGRKPDVVKFVYHHTPGAMPSIDRQTLQAGIETATDAGIPTVIHVGSWEDAWHAVDAGATAITHLPRGSVVSEEMARDIAERGTLWIPTMVAHLDHPNFVSGELLDDPMLKRLLATNVLDSYAASDHDGPSADQDTRRHQRLESFAIMLEAGVPLVVGTDAGNSAVVQGYSVHRELLLMVEHGVPTWEALRAATVTPGRLLGEKWGLEEGSEGSVLILDASPVEDISATRQIHAVVQRGQLVDRESLLGDAP